MRWTRRLRSAAATGRHRRCIAALFTALAIVIVAGAATAQHHRRPLGLTFEPLFSLTAHSGQRLSRAELAGRPFVVLFGFTHCPDVCPTALLDWSHVLADLGAAGDRIKVLFVFVDTERDTPAVLRQYLAAFDQRIVGLSGSPVEIAAVSHAFNAFYERVERKGDVLFDHTTKAYLVDRYGLLAAAIDFKAEARHRHALLQRVLAQ